MKKLILVHLYVLFHSGLFAQTLDPSFLPFFTTTSTITSSALQTDNKLIVAGNFITVGQSKVQLSGGMVRLNLDGTIDNTFDVGFGADNNLSVYALAIQPDGKILVGGSFRIFSGQSVNRIVRLNTNGSIDASFNAGGKGFGNYTVIAIAAQSDGKIIVAGTSDTYNGSPIKSIIRLNSNGTLDTSFNQVDAPFLATDARLAIQPTDNKILVTRINSVNGASVPKMARLNADGSVDNTFMTNLGLGPDNSMAGLDLQSDGKILISGSFNKVNGTSRNKIARLNSDGTLDTFASSIGIASGSSADFVKALSDGSIILGGIFGAPKKSLIKLSNSGIVDNTFDPGNGLDKTYSEDGKGPSLRNIHQQSDGKVLITGTFDSYNGTVRLSLARVTSTGAAETLYNPNPAGVATIYKAEQLTNGKILVCGDFKFINGVYYPNIARLLSTGAVDNTFALSGITLEFGSEIKTFAIQPTTDKIIIGGPMIYNTNSAYIIGLARLNVNGNFDNTFSGFTGVVQTSASDGVYAIKTLADDRIIIGGRFTAVNGTAKVNFARLSSNGALDNTFNTGADFPGRIIKIETRSSDGKMLLTADTRNTNSQYAPLVNLANPDGSIVSSFDISAKFEQFYAYKVRGSIFLPDGKILIGGDFAKYDGVNVQSLIKIDDAGVRDFTFKSPTNYASYDVNELYYSASLNAIAVGKALNINYSSATDYFDLIDLNGNQLAEGTGIQGKVSSINPIGTSLLLGGAITKTSSEDVNSLVRILIPTNAPANAPTTLQAVPFNNVTRFVLNWTDNSAEESGFEIQRSELNNTNYKTIAIAPGNSTSYVDDSPLNNSTLYFYKIRAVNLVGQSGFSNEVGNSTLPTPPIAPTNFGANVLTETKMLLTWKNNPSNGTELELYRSSGTNSNYSLLSTIAISSSQDVKQFTDTGLTIGTTYYYKIRAKNPGGFSDYSPEIDIVAGSTPNAPTNLSNVRFSPFKARLNWVDNSSNETSFQLYQFIPSTQVSTLVTTFPANTTTYLLTGLNSLSEYLYYVVAINGGGSSAPSNTTSVFLKDVLSGEWTDALTTSLPGRSGGVALVLNGKAYVGLGENASGALKDWWEYDAALNVWTKKTDFPGTARIGAVGFVANGKGYVGTGNDFSGNGFTRDFYEYDAANNTWSQKADFPQDFSSGAGITSGVAFAIDNLGYVGLGNTGVNNTKAFYQYNSVTNAWVAKADFAGNGRIGAIGFAANGKGYVGFGYGGLSTNPKDMWEYYAAANTWSTKASYPGEGRGGATAVAVNGESFLFGGEEWVSFFTSNRTNANTQYIPNQTDGIWSSLAPMPLPVRSSAMSFVIGNKAYVYGGYHFSSGNIYYNDLYAFTPGSNLIPSAPTPASVTFVSESSLKCSWTDVSDNETSFVVELSVPPSINQYVVVSTLPAGTKEYTVTGLTANAQYQFRVKAVNAYGASSYVYSGTIYTSALPEAPTALAAQALSTSSIKLTWTDNSTNETGFKIFRSQSNNTSYALLTVVPAGTNTFTDQFLIADVTYYYKIQAINNGGESAFDNEASQATLPLPPFSPGSVAIQSSTSSQVVLAWVDRSSNETGFEIYRRGGVGSYSLLKTTAANVTTYTDTGLTIGTTYTYFVRSINSGGFSINSNEASISIVPDAPASPSDLVITSVASNQIILNWVDKSLNETGFEIFRSLNGAGNYTLLFSPQANATTYTDLISPTTSTSYFYKVRAINAGGNSVFSNEVTTMITALEDAANESSLVCYPNPIHQELLISNPTSELLNFVVLNTLSQVVISGKVASREQISVPAFNWSSGLYILKVLSSNKPSIALIKE